MVAPRVRSSRYETVFLARSVVIAMMVGAVVMYTVVQAGIDLPNKQIPSNKTLHGVNEKQDKRMTATSQRSPRRTTRACTQYRASHGFEYAGWYPGWKPVGCWPWLLTRCKSCASGGAGSCSCWYVERKNATRLRLSRREK